MALTKITGDVIATNTSITAVGATFTGNVSIAGTISYEDVTNVDSVGLITARSGINITSGGLIVTGVSTVSAGSTSAPSISPSGDSNTGIFFPSADTIAFGEGGAEAARIDSSGRFAIGTNSPLSGAQLTVAASALAITGQNLDHSANSIRIGEEGSGAAQIRCYGPNASTNGSLTFRMSRSDGSNSQDITIDSNGRLGIANNTPSYTLDVTGSARITSASPFWLGTTTGDSYIQYGASATTANNWTVGAQGDGSFRFFNGTYASGTERLRITSDGKLGLGTSSPSYKFHLARTDAAGDYAYMGASSDNGARGLVFSSADNGAFLGAIHRIRASSGSGELRLGTSSSDALTIDSSQRVGIGTNEPSNQGGQKLTVRSGSIAISNNTASGTNGELRFIGTPDGVNYNWAGIRAISDVNINQGALAFLTSGSNTSAESSTERARIDTSGRLLVGTSSARSNVYTGANLSTPFCQIENNTASYDQGLSLLNYSADGYPSSLTLGVSLSGTKGTNTLVRNNEMLGRINFAGNDGTNFRSAALIEALVDGTPGSGDMPGRLVFSTTADGASSPTERMRINSNGIIQARNGAGDTLNLYNAVSAGTSSGFIYGVHSSTSAYNGTTSFVVYTNGNVVNTNGSYTTLSDVKLKENIVDAGSQWDDLKAIRIRNWNFKEETGHETHRQIGPIAQELEQVCPGLVFDTPDRDADGNKIGEVTKGVNQSVLYMKAVKALQEAMERIEQLETEMAAVKAQLS